MFRPLTHLKPFATLGAVAIFAAALALPAQARPTRGDTTTIAVIGDSVANDLGRGLEDLVGNKRHVRVVKQTRFATGLVRTDYYDWNAVLTKFLRHHRPNVILVVIGGNDHQALRVHGRRYEPFSKGWMAEYRRRVARFMRHFKHTHAQVYWVSLPPVRSHTLTRAYRKINAIYRREATRHGFHYLSVWKRFLSDGAYSSFGESLEGVKRRLRKQDGMHFTGAGRILFAAYVANAIGLR